MGEVISVLGRRKSPTTFSERAFGFGYLRDRALIESRKAFRTAHVVYHNILSLIERRRIQIKTKEPNEV